jgi:hypothetical protein
MNAIGESGGRLRRAWFRWAGALPAAVASIALLAAACGGSSTSAPPLGGPLYASALAFTQCMRTHGEPGYPFPIPEPGNAVAFKITPGSHLVPGSARYQAAHKACGRLLAGRTGLPPGLAERAASAMLRYATCMRSHGVANFPDPVSNGKGVSFPAVSGVDPHSGQFQSAQQACQPFLPSGGAGP